ncbi:uncharacterized protein LOC143462045 isoform X3 [Clavelina lepadiformis]|uniref:uncharacterized protein LOC143462045 isoform X3 n=1 Tax=Clavelina lepadiformis TaxID=159417 RepID=UPI004041927C
MACCKDYVTEQTQNAPLADSFTLSPVKRRLSNDYPCKNLKRIRESLRSQTRKPVKDKIIAKSKPHMMPDESIGSLFTICSLCELHFKTELELEEHLYSLLHHRALDTEKGKDFMHECNLCCITCKGLSEYVSHLQEGIHRDNMEKRKQYLRNNKLSGPVYGLMKYRDTFMCKPKKDIHPKPIEDRAGSSLSPLSLAEECSNIKQPLEYGSAHSKIDEHAAIKTYHQNSHSPLVKTRFAGRSCYHPQSSWSNQGEQNQFLWSKHRHQPRGAAYHQRYFSRNAYGPRMPTYGQHRPSFRSGPVFNHHNSSGHWEWNTYDRKPTKRNRYKRSESSNSSLSVDYPNSGTSRIYSTHKSESFSTRTPIIKSHVTPAHSDPDLLQPEPFFVPNYPIIQSITKGPSNNDCSKLVSTAEMHRTSSTTVNNNTISQPLQMQDLLSSNISHDKPKQHKHTGTTVSKLKPLLNIPKDTTIERSEQTSDFPPSKDHCTSNISKIEDVKVDEPRHHIGWSTSSRKQPKEKKLCKSSSDATSVDSRYASKRLKALKCLVTVRNGDLETNIKSSFSSEEKPLTAELSLDHNSTQSAVTFGSAECNTIRRKFKAIMDELKPPTRCSSISSGSLLSTQSSFAAQIFTKKFTDKSSTETIDSDRETLEVKTMLSDHETKLQAADKDKGKNLQYDEVCCSDSSLRKIIRAESFESKKGTAVKLQPVPSSSISDEPIRKFTVLDVAETDCTSRGKSPEIVRNQLLKLAKRKQNELDCNQNEHFDSSLQVNETFDEESTTSSLKLNFEQVPCDRKSDDVDEPERCVVDASKKHTPKPNVRKARSRLVVREHKPSANNSDSDKKQARLAKLLLKLSGRTTRRKADSSQAKRRLSGPRFGIGLVSRDATKSYSSMDESDLEDIIMSIAQQDGALHEIGATTKRVRSFSEGESTVNGESRMQEKHKLVSTNSELPCASHNTPGRRSGNFSSQLLEMSEREELLHRQSKNVKEKSVKLLEEITHVNELIEQLDVRRKELDEENENNCREDRKIALELQEIRQNRLKILRENFETSGRSHSSAQNISLQPGSYLHSTPTPTSKPDLLYLSACTSPTVTKVQSSFSHSQPSIENSCVANIYSNDNSKYDTANTRIDLDLSMNSTSNTPLTKANAEVPRFFENDCNKNSSTIVQSNSRDEPFPVSSSSTYFQAHMDKEPLEEASKPDTTAVDAIIRRYLEDASNEREVTSSTMRKKDNALLLDNGTLSQPPSDTEVTSTTPNHKSLAKDISHGRVTENQHQENDRHAAVKPQSAYANEENVRPKKKTKTLPRDPYLAKLSLQQPLTTDITASWVTAHDGSINSFTNHPSENNRTLFKPATLTSAETEITLKHANSFPLHTASVLCVFVTQCKMMITCSKDKLVHVTDLKTGQILKSYNLSSIPLAAYIIPESSNQMDEKQATLLSLYVVFVDETGDRNSLTESSLHQLFITINTHQRFAEMSCQFQATKLLDYSSSLLCMHRNNNLLYLGARDGRVVVFNKDQHQIQDILDCHSPHAVCCLTTGTDGARRVLCCGSSDCRVSVRDATDGLLLRILSGHTKTVNCLQLINHLLYSGSSDRSVLVHDIHSGDMVHRFLGLHGGSIKMLKVHFTSIVTLCLDKKLRVLRNEKPPIYGIPKSIDGLPLCMHLYQSDVTGDQCRPGMVVPVVCIGCQDGKIQIIPLPHLASVKTQSTVQVWEKCNTSPKSLNSSIVIDLTSDFQCLWSGCKAAGFTCSTALLAHIDLFHTTDAYKENLNCCCLWDNCTHYFSSDLDTALDVHLHVEKHLIDVLKPPNQHFSTTS